MRSFVQTPLVWLLAALFILSAGHGIFFHAGHTQETQDCALCVLAWTLVIVTAAVFAVAVASSHVWSNVRAEPIPYRALVYDYGQRAPPSGFLR